MIYATRVAAAARHVGTFVLHFAHGSLLVAGLVVTVVFGMRVFDQGLSGLPLNNLFGHAEASVAAEDSLSPADLVAVEQDQVVVDPEHPDRLSPEMERVTEYLARRYKVARAAVEPLIVSAQKVGQSVGLDPLLIVAVMGIESSFNPFAESPFGAQGLMQIVPRFHQDKFDEKAGDAPLLDPTENIRVGAQVLKEYIRRNGSLTAGLQQYGGAADDPAEGYANKVIAEKQRLQLAMRQGAKLALAK
ncbi:transglycosylase SLT domain-containing protein [Niveibacterium sp.]|uniref:transglycosylase SLT domain-containing protein n=1 Tax=Niveibacterium sp. TaxID=2017444 RepID=UPI0035B34BDD